MAARSRAITSRDNAVVIEGLSGFAKALKAVDEDFPKSLRKANYDLAGEIVTRARSEARSEGPVEAAASRSLKSARSANSSTVVGGGARYPYFWGAEFGSKAYKQFQPWRGNQWGGWEGGPGYFLHPTIRRDAKALLDEYMKTIDALTAKAFPE